MASNPDNETRTKRNLRNLRNTRTSSRSSERMERDGCGGHEDHESEVNNETSGDHNPLSFFSNNKEPNMSYQLTVSVDQSGGLYPEGSPAVLGDYETLQEAQQELEDSCIPDIRGPGCFTITGPDGKPVDLYD